MRCNYVINTKTPNESINEGKNKYIHYVALCDIVKGDVIMFNDIVPSCRFLLLCTVQYNTVQYNAVQYSTVQYSTVQYNAAPAAARGGCLIFLLLKLDL